jgi:hypothetical protein
VFNQDLEFAAVPFATFNLLVLLLFSGMLRRRTRTHIRSNLMPLFMDTHGHIEGLTADAVAQAHAADLNTQEKYGVKYLRYWFDENSGKVFCLVEAPNKEAAIAVHREAHGLLADEIIEVKEGS